MTHALQSCAALIQSSWQKAPHFLHTTMAFKRHEQLFSNMDRLKPFEATVLGIEPFVLVLEVDRRDEFSLSATCFCIAALDGGLCFISVAGARRSTVSLLRIDALNKGVVVDSLVSHSSEADSGIFNVLFRV